ncbi:MAG: hypothetical protein Q9221_002685 [Calogaya cf. arnoldii]
MTPKIQSLYPLLLLLVSESMAATDCFTQVGELYTKSANKTHRISVGIICPPSEKNFSCPLKHEGFIEEAGTLNITTQYPDKIFEAVQTPDRLTPFSSSTKGLGPKGIYKVQSGTAGWYGFTVKLGCYTGTLGDCIGGDVKPGTSIEACTPMTPIGRNNAGLLILDGTSAFVLSDNITVSGMTTNPSAIAMPAPEDTQESATEDTQESATEETQESVATAAVLGNGVLIFVTLANFLWCTI